MWCERDSKHFKNKDTCAFRILGDDHEERVGNGEAKRRRGRTKTSLPQETTTSPPLPRARVMTTSRDTDIPGRHRVARRASPHHAVPMTQAAATLVVCAKALRERACTGRGTRTSGRRDTSAGPCASSRWRWRHAAQQGITVGRRVRDVVSSRADGNCLLRGVRMQRGLRELAAA